MKSKQTNHFPDDLIPTGNRLLRMLKKYPNLSEADIVRECKAFYIQMVLGGVIDYDSIGFYGLQSGWLHRVNFELNELEILKKEMKEPNDGFWKTLWRKK